MIGPFWYRAQLVKNGPFVGIKVWHHFPIDPDTGDVLTERGERWYAELNGQGVPLDEVVIEMDGVTGRPVVKGFPCDEIDYRHLSNIAQWAAEHAPNDPYASPRKAIDMNALKPIKFRR